MPCRRHWCHRGVGPRHGRLRAHPRARATLLRATHVSAWPRHAHLLYAFWTRTHTTFTYVALSINMRREWVSGPLHTGIRIALSLEWPDCANEFHCPLYVSCVQMGVPLGPVVGLSVLLLPRHGHQPVGAARWVGRAWWPCPTPSRAVPGARRCAHTYRRTVAMPTLILFIPGSVWEA